LWRAGERRRVLALGCAFAAALGIAAVYTVPALLEKDLVGIGSIDSGIFHPTKNLIQWSWTLQSGFFSLGMATWIGLAITLLCPLLPWARRSFRALAFFWIPGAVLWALMHAWAEPFWWHWPLGSYIQFPWRLLGFVGVLASAGIAVTFSTVIKPSWSVRWPLALIVAAAVIHAEQSHVHVGKFLDREQFPTTPEEIAAGTYTSVLVDEYLPKTVHPPPVTPREHAYVLPSVDNTLVAVHHPSSLHYALRVRTHGASLVDLRVFWFPGWKLRAQSGPGKIAIGASPQGLIRLTFPREGEYTAHVDFGLTPLRWLATLLSWLSIILIYPLLRRIMPKINGPERIPASRRD
jgi:hypothetical protein